MGGGAIIHHAGGCHPEVFEIRRLVLTELDDHGFEWPADFGAVDIWADAGRVEVAGIRTERLATEIARVLHQQFPHWGYPSSTDAGSEDGEPGWRVAIIRHSEDRPKQRQAAR